MATSYTMTTEVNRKRRGHAFLPPKAVMRRVPTMDELPDPAKTFWVKFFSPSLTWYVAAIDDDGVAYGYVVNHADPWCSEWGSFSLAEMEAVYRAPFIIIERDKFFDPAPVADVMARLDAGQHV